MKTIFMLGLVLPCIALAQQPSKVTPQQFVNLQEGDIVHKGFRRAHAKGICISGEFLSNGSLTKYTHAKVFEKGSTPFIGRFSIAGSNPSAPDLKAPVRSMALSFATSATQQWRVAMNTPPVMAVSDPHTFYQQIIAIKAGPEAIQKFFKDHPESQDFLNWKSSYQPSGSFAAETYNSINAFYLINEQDEKQAVRWHMRPTLTATPEGLKGEDALQQELQQRLAKEDIVFDWVYTLATEADNENDPARAWPNSRQQITAGQLVIRDWQFQLKGECHSINYDPLVLPEGIEPTADPILRARSGAYAESYRRRAREVLNGALEANSNE
ncbi:catalase family peroxidase [Aestuariicella hydrocarbonica]|uniref:Catalase-related peroxidase n=1 Tax=Pseudomaricurvus hydrocarbonicus TaxID=1470433 RepID=A0A9E5MMX3_9GAMM|nr:catalase family peroxidase [Aestuariicella hydrocarbonica]NHO67196.1 catalase family peroxidase [Aestuariicella hydrocarbonica]